MATDPLRTEVVVIGAGPAGVAAGACLKVAQVPFEILERGDRIAAVWHRHYERLHLHTDKAHSNLPHFPFPKAHAKYPSRAEVIEYLEAYASRFDLRPRFHQDVASATMHDGEWHTRTRDRSYISCCLIVATGYTGKPVVPSWPGDESFGGEIIHSSEYRNGEPYRDRSVLVVGFGNSGGEIAIDLYEHGARSHLSVRSPVNVVPRDLFGLPILAIAIPMRILPTGLADAMTAPIVRWKIGDISKLGLEPARYGPLAQILGKSRIPLIDVGTIDLIRRGEITVHPGIDRFTETEVSFTDGDALDCDAVVLATGYAPSVSSFLGDSAALDSNGVPKTTGRESEVPGLFFCGFYVAPTGMFREIAREAKQIANAIASKRA